MATPTSYTEATLKEYLHGCTQRAGINLGWSIAEGNYDETVADTELALGTAVADTTNIRALRAVARRELWRAVMQATSHLATAQTGAAGSIAYGKTVFDRAKDLHAQASTEVEMLGLETIASKPPIGMWVGGR
jgi:hypothetical protein